ncbi:hypothetical protein ABZ318_00835 [Streptomyces sp. NPDC006197]|uniref:hypothetical protein n=1 Tax=Streptomyces sp. NPDC006197 TaxID=3156685 RepID=UPI0033B4152E
MNSSDGTSRVVVGVHDSASPLPGPVSRRRAVHASCPVAIVRADAPGGAAPVDLTP